MGLFSEYRQLMGAYREHRSLGAARGHPPNRAPRQLRLDISAAGLGGCLVEKGVVKDLFFKAADGYEAALGLAGETAGNRRMLRSGMALVASFWPESVRLTQIPVGSGQTYASSKVLDVTVQVNPEGLHLDGSYLFRALDGQSNSADVIGIAGTGLATLSKVVPRGVSVGRYWGPLAALDVLYDTLKGHLSKQLLFGICDAQKVYYFILRNGMVSGLRVSARATLRNVDDVCNYLVSAGIQPPAICLVALNIDSNDLEKLGPVLGKDKRIEAGIMGRNDLLKGFGVFRDCGDAAQLPVSLLQEGAHG